MGLICCSEFLASARLSSSIPFHSFLQIRCCPFHSIPSIHSISSIFNSISIQIPSVHSIPFHSFHPFPPPPFLFHPSFHQIIPYGCCPPSIHYPLFIHPFISFVSTSSPFHSHFHSFIHHLI